MEIEKPVFIANVRTLKPEQVSIQNTSQVDTL
jgi:hypothetical protein